MLHLMCHFEVIVSFCFLQEPPANVCNCQYTNNYVHNKLIIFNVGFTSDSEAKNFMGLKLYQDDGKHANILEWVECNGLQEIEANVNLMVQLEERLGTP